MKKGDLVKLKGGGVTCWFGYGIVVELSGSRMCRVMWSKDFGKNKEVPHPDDDWMWNTNLELINEAGN